MFSLWRLPESCYVLSLWANPLPKLGDSHIIMPSQRGPMRVAPTGATAKHTCCPFASVPVTSTPGDQPRKLKREGEFQILSGKMTLKKQQQKTVIPVSFLQIKEKGHPDL